MTRFPGLPRENLGQRRPPAASPARGARTWTLSRATKLPPARASPSKPPPSSTSASPRSAKRPPRLSSSTAPHPSTPLPQQQTHMDPHPWEHHSSPCARSAPTRPLPTSPPYQPHYLLNPITAPHPVHPVHSPYSSHLSYVSHPVHPSRSPSSPCPTSHFLTAPISGLVQPKGHRRPRSSQPCTLECPPLALSISWLLWRHRDRRPCNFFLNEYWSFRKPSNTAA